MDLMQIKLLGEISIEANGRRICDSDNRTKKSWLLLSYLICQRSRVVSQKKLIELLWGEDPSSSNPENALRITLHRLRGLLNELWPTAGRDLLIYKDGGYTWNDAYPIILDCEQFELLCNRQNEDAAIRLQDCLKALELYHGEFLEKQSAETWVIPVSTHFHNLYIQISMEAVTLLSGQGQHKESIAICQKAIISDPYHEPLYQLLIKELAAIGDTQGACATYSELSTRLFDDFGIRPSQETQEVYRAAVHTLSERSLAMDDILEHLQEPDSAAGAMQCDYDYFKVLCFAESRSLERSGNSVHLVLLSVTSGNDIPLSKKTQRRIMEQLGEQIRLNLRRGDIFSQCSVSQFIIMLPQANYENSCMVCRRVLGAFYRRHPHVHAQINHMVQPLSPGTYVP